jgi:hypothetical protein
MRLLTLGVLMRRFQPSILLGLSSVSGGLAGLTIGNPGVRDVPLPNDLSELLRTTAMAIAVACREHNLVSSLATCERIDRLLKAGGANYEEAKALFNDLDSRLVDELDARHFLAIEPNKTQLLVGPIQFGAEVASAFPSAVTDIEEAAKCLALARGTACVFHLMRILECALRTLAASLNDPDLDPHRNPSWDTILRKCRAELARPLAQRSPEWKRDDQFYSAVTERLMAVKDAWRNPTMHVEKKYTEEEAEDTWNATRAFMRQVATKIHE